MTEKTPWTEHPGIWKTKSAFMSFLRGGIRRALWNRSPIKIEFIKNNRKKIANPNHNGRVKEVWGGICALTGKEFPLNELEVDHVVGNHSLNNLSDLQSFIENIVCISFSDLQFVSKEAHRIKSYADKQGITYAQASIEKTIIAIFKEKGDIQFLKKRGLEPASTIAKRKLQIREVLENE